MENSEQTREERFVSHVIKRCAEDNGFAARLRRAVNEDTEYQSWDILAPFVDLENAYQRRAYALVGAAVVLAKLKHDGSFSLGSTLKGCEKPDADSDSGLRRLRRFLACDDTIELCNVLRPLLGMLTESRFPLCYSRLLRELLYFSGDSARRTKAHWAAGYYGNNENNEEEGS